MKLAFQTLLAIFSFTASLSAQDFSQTDTYARSFKKSNFNSPEALSKAIVKELHTDIEKYRALYTWIAHNIQYDRAKAKNMAHSVRFSGTEAEITKQEKAWEDKTIQKTYRSGKGVCNDYSMLYQRMCEAAGLRCEIINGKSRQESGKMGNDHAWNAIWVDGTWHLLDVTWGAGGSNNLDKDFRFDFREGYFMTSPKLFVLDHLPEEEKWQLLDHPFTEKELLKQPYLNYGNSAYPLSDFAFGRLSDEKSAEIRLQFKKEKPQIINLYSKNEDKMTFIQSEQNGFVTLRFKVPGSGAVSVFVSAKSDKTEKKLAHFNTMK